MKTSKIKSLGLALAICLTSMGMQAQGTNDIEIQKPEQLEQEAKHKRAKKSPEDRAAHKTARLVEKLKLNEKQEAEILAIHLDMSKEHEARKRAERAEREAKRIEIEKQYQSILTEEQFKVYEKQQLKRSAEWKDADGNVIPRKKRMKKGKKNRGEKASKSCCSTGEAKKSCAKDCSKDCCAPKK